MKRRICENTELKPLKLTIIHYTGHVIWDNVECDELIDQDCNRIHLNEIDLNNIGQYFAFGRYGSDRYCSLGNEYTVVINDEQRLKITREYFTPGRRFTGDLVTTVVNAYHNFNSMDYVEEPDSEMPDIF